MVKKFALAPKAGRTELANGSSNLEQQLLQDRLFEIIEADRFDEYMPFAANDMIAIVYVETFGRLLRKNILRRLYDNWQSIDHDTFPNQRISNLMKSGNTLVIVAISGNINDLPAASELLVEPRVAEQKRLADQSINPELRTLCLFQSISE